MLLPDHGPHVDVTISTRWEKCLTASILAHLPEGDTPAFAVDDDVPGTARQPETVSA
jgi:hypothetical protein